MFTFKSHNRRIPEPCTHMHTKLCSPHTRRESMGRGDTQHAASLQHARVRAAMHNLYRQYRQQRVSSRSERVNYVHALMECSNSCTSSNSWHCCQRESAKDSAGMLITLILSARTPVWQQKEWCHAENGAAAQHAPCTSETDVAVCMRASPYPAQLSNVWRHVAGGSSWDTSAASGLPLGKGEGEVRARGRARVRVRVRGGLWGNHMVST